MPAFVDLTGRRFGRLLVQRMLRGHRSETAQKRTTYAVCLCDCGTSCEVVTSSLKRGLTRSCGCLKDESARRPNLSKRLASGQSNMNVVVKQYRHTAKRRGLPFSLPVVRVHELLRSDCFYCGSPPSSVMHKKGSFGEFIYNGLDRVDSSAGYVEGNVVSACVVCNWMKSTMPLGKFIEHVRRIAAKWASVDVPESPETKYSHPLAASRALSDVEGKTRTDRRPS